MREDCTEAQESQISHFAHQLPKAANTSFFGDLFQSEMYQAHLERISDYLLPGEGVWWHRDEESCSIVFHDSVDEDDWRDEGPAMCHFRSSSLKSIELRVQSSWEKCLADAVTLPIERIKLYDEEGDVSSIQHFQLFGATSAHEVTDDHTVPAIPEITSLQQDDAAEVCVGLMVMNEAEYTLEKESSEVIIKLLVL